MSQNLGKTQQDLCNREEAMKILTGACKSCHFRPDLKKPEQRKLRLVETDATGQEREMTEEEFREALKGC